MNFEYEIERYLKKTFSKFSQSHCNSNKKSGLISGQKLLKKALFYSFKGKASRFRPRLCFETAQVLGYGSKQILPWAIALEMVHTASLIHDDMPCMDQAETRRGKKCNHLIFGEDIALLAGTCLFVESFSLLNDPLFDKKKSELLDMLVRTIGFHGLMSGQALDLKNKSSNKKELLNIMNLKTGVLISTSVLGPALLWANKQEYKALESFAKHLGVTYQLADDYQDVFQDSSKLINNKNQLKANILKMKQQKVTGNNQDLKKIKENWFYKEGILRLEKSKKALTIFGGKAKNLKLLITELENRFKSS